MNLLDIVGKIPFLPTASPVADRPSRRDLFSPAALAALWATAGRQARAAQPRGDSSTNLWLIQHITNGLTEAEIARLQSMGDQAYIEYQLDYESIDDSALDERIAQYLALPLEPFQVRLLPWNQVISELSEATILRSALSERQLYQRMVEFWTDHFHIDINRDICGYLKLVDDREVIRPHALGTFRNLLGASAHSPAMLRYLDNHISRVGQPNENYARELMELHTLGVDGGYTQQDVIEVARCLTGWGMYSASNGTDSWKFRWNVVDHDQGQKVVLGNAIPPNGGINDGEMVLDILANHPSTAQFLARKMTRWFWGYDAPQSLVDAVAAAYTASGGQIKPMVRAIFNNPEAALMPLKYKRPYHQFISALRATNASIESTTAMRQSHLAAAGHPLFQWTAPDGYPDRLDFWAGLILPRWNFGASLLNDEITGLSVDVDAFLAGAATADTIADRIDAAFFGGAMPLGDKDRIRDYLLPDPPSPSRMREAIGLAIDSPGFQWY